MHGSCYGSLRQTAEHSIDADGADRLAHTDGNTAIDTGAADTGADVDDVDANTAVDSGAADSGAVNDIDIPSVSDRRATPGVGRCV